MQQRVAYGREVEVKDNDANSGHTGLQRCTPSLDDVLNQIRGEFILKTGLAGLNCLRECVFGTMNHFTGTTVERIHISYELYPHSTVLCHESTDVIQWTVTKFLRPQFYVALLHSFLIMHTSTHLLL